MLNTNVGSFDDDLTWTLGMSMSKSIGLVGVIEMASESLSLELELELELSALPDLEDTLV